MNFKGFGGRGINQGVQESIARTQLEAVNRRSKAKAQAKQRERSTVAKRLELLEDFALRQLVNNGKEEATVIDKDLTLGILVVKLARNGKRATWAPEFAYKGAVSS